MPKRHSNNKAKGTTKKKSASPFSTGGGGTSFEQVVGTFYLATLLLEAPPLGHEGGVVREVRFQRRFIDGDPLDDVLLLLDVAEAPNRTARLSLQLKHDLDWGDNVLFNEVIHACWERLNDPGFTVGFDRFGIGIGIQKATYRYYQMVLQFAATSATAADFQQKIAQIASETCRTFVALIRERLDHCVTQQDHPTGLTTDDELWTFLRSMVIISFDVLDPNSRDRYDSIERLRYAYGLHLRQASDIWDRMLVLMVQGLPLAASQTRESLIGHLKLKGIKLPPLSTVADLGDDDTMSYAGSDRREAIGIAASVAPASVKVPDDTGPRAIVEAKLDAKVDVARDLINKGRFEDARLLLLEVRDNKDVIPSAKLLFRVAANLGACAFGQDDVQEAVREFGIAYRQDPTNPKAKVVGAQGELLAGNFAHAASLCEEALQIEPRLAEAAFISMQALHWDNRDLELEAFLSREMWVQDVPECATALSEIRADQGDTTEAIRLLQTSRERERNDPQLNAHLGAQLLHRAQGRLIQDIQALKPIPLEVIRDLEEAIDMLSGAIRKYEHFDNHRLLHDTLTNRAVARGMLEDFDTGIKDCNRVLGENPQHPGALANKAWLLLRKGDNEGVIELQQDLATADWQKAMARSLSLAHLQLQQWQQAVDVLTPALNTDPTTQEEFELLDLWNSAQHSLKRQTEIDIVLNNLAATRPDDPDVLLLRANQKMRENKGSRAVALLRRALSLSTDDRKRRLTLALAEAFYYSRRFTASLSFYKRVVDENHASPYLEHYVTALLSTRTGMREAHRIARQLRKGGKALLVYSEAEAYVAEIAGDWKEAIRLRRELVQLQPNRTVHRLRLALMEYHTGGPAVARQVIRDIPPAAYSNSPTTAMQIAHAGAMLGVPDALELAYEIRRANINNSQVHFDYVAVFQKSAKEDNPVLWPVQGRVGCAVTLEANGEKSTRLLVEGTLVLPEEVSVHEARGNDLLHTRKGDTVVVKQSAMGLGATMGTVTDVQHRYVYAFQDTIRRLGRGEIYHPALDVQHVEDPDEFLKRQVSVLNARRREGEEVTDLYQRYPIPLASIATARRESIFDFWYEIRSVGGRFFCANDEINDLIKHVNSLADVQTLALDPTALFTVVLLEAEKYIKARFPRLVVAHAVWAELREQLLQAKLNPIPAGYLSTDGIRPIFIEVSRERIEHKHKFLERVLGFIENSCEILPVYSLAEQKAGVVRVFGESTLASILLAREQGLLLYCDDLRTRLVAQTEFTVQTTYCLPVVAAIPSQEMASQAKIESLYTLLSHGYTYLLVSTDVLIEWLQQREMNISETTRSVLNGVLADGSLAWTARLAAGLLAHCWSERLMAHRFKIILAAVLEAFLEGRSTQTALQELVSELRLLLQHNPVAERQIIQDIHIWYQDNLRWINRGSLLQRGNLQVAPLEITFALWHPANEIEM